MNEEMGRGKGKKNPNTKKNKSQEE